MAYAVKLSQYDKTRKLFLRTDASIVGLGAFLYQLDDSQNIMPLHDLSCSPHNAETRYSSQKLELLAIKWFLGVLKNCNDLTIITDHKS